MQALLLFADEEAEGDPKDLIDDNPIEESDGDDCNDSEGSKKRKKSDDEDELDDCLEDEDYDLLEENLGVRLERKVSAVSFPAIFLYFFCDPRGPVGLAHSWDSTVMSISDEPNKIY